GGGALNSEKIAEKADKNDTFSDLKIEKKTLEKETKSTLRDGDFIAEIATAFSKPRNDTEREKAGGLSFRPSPQGRVEKSQQNQDFCHCEETHSVDAAISPLKKDQKKAKVVVLILSIIFLFTALVGGSVFLIVKHITKTTATTESPTLTTNLFNTNGTINSSAANELLTTVGYWDNMSSTAKYTAHNIAGRTSNNSGSTIIFPMGYVNGTSGDPLYWQATYLSGNYLSIWLSKCYTTSDWNASPVSPSYDTYATSTIQAYIDDTFYPLVTQSSSTLKSIFATPAVVGYQTLKSGTSNDTSYYYSSSYTSKFDNMSTIVGNGSYMWLPSHGEVSCNTTSSYTNNTTSYTGQWGLNSTDRAFTTSLYADTSTTNFYCWLRSGHSYYSRYALLVYTSGSAGEMGVDGSRGVRPAAHISLNALANQVTASAGSNCSVDKTSQIYNSSNNTPLTFTYTANTNYYIKSLTIDGTIATITNSTTAPSSYTTLTNTQYKAYRPTVSTVAVILYAVTADISISATAAGYITLTNSNTSKITNASFTRTTYDTTTATITATYASGYYPQFKYNSNNYIKISTAGGSGVIGTVAYDYTFTSNFLTLNFSNLPTGVSNIPTITLNTHTLADNVITVNAPNATYNITYESNQASVLIEPNSGYYVTQAYVDSNGAEDINQYMGALVNAGNALAVVYYASANSNKVEFVFRVLSGNLTLNIVMGNTQPKLQASGGTSVDVVAVYATNGGEVRLTGSDLSDDSDTVVCMAVAYAGYEFVNWTDSDGSNLGTALSIRLTKEQVQGKVITANFAKIDANVNTETNNTENLT
ncbi:MAG: hypothetical protein IJ301_03020, partial [Clostridia bacterium]|nr:hypothetical protein [Clostridia bacterium]